MFAEELADLKNRYGPRFELVHVLSREPRDVELFSGRLDADRLRAAAHASWCRSATVDHVWLCGPFAHGRGRPRGAGRARRAAEKVHFELFFVDEPPPELRHAEPGGRRA